MNADKLGRGPGRRPGNEVLGQTIACSGSEPLLFRLYILPSQPQQVAWPRQPNLIITIHSIPKALILAHGAGVSPWLTIQRTTPNLPPSPDGDETPSARIYIMLTIKSYL